MHIIPVIDVRHGIAVRAVAGDRDNYGPLQTPLVRAGEPGTGDKAGLTALEVARGYRNFYPFPTVYIADLDGIEGRGRDAGMAGSLQAALPDVEFWIDAGCKSGLSSGQSVGVVGSEVLREIDIGLAIASDHVLSLDFRGDDFVGPQTLLARPELWPSRIIVMTLARVGAGRGPDLGRIAHIAGLAQQCKVYAAGGIRDVTDLRAARAAGAHGALIASALHSQKIKADDLQEITGL